MQNKARLIFQYLMVNVWLIYAISFDFFHLAKSGFSVGDSKTKQNLFITRIVTKNRSVLNNSPIYRCEEGITSTRFLPLPPKVTITRNCLEMLIEYFL